MGPARRKKIPNDQLKIQEMTQHKSTIDYNNCTIDLPLLFVFSLFRMNFRTVIQVAYSLEKHVAFSLASKANVWLSTEDFL